MPVKIDYDVLSAREGGRKTKGYVPAASSSKSGVTIATGFDLGQRNKKDLRLLDLGSPLIKKFGPYLGVTGPDAVSLLSDSPLTITAAQALRIDRAVKATHLRRLKSAYNSVRDNKKRFEEIIPAAQTVIASVSFQYGTNLSVRTPKFWAAVTEQDWPRTVKILKSFGDAYPSRRNLEAALLNKAISEPTQ